MAVGIGKDIKVPVGQGLTDVSLTKEELISAPLLVLNQDQYATGDNAAGVPKPAAPQSTGTGLRLRSQDPKTVAKQLNDALPPSSKSNASAPVLSPADQKTISDLRAMPPHALGRFGLDELESLTAYKELTPENKGKALHALAVMTEAGLTDHPLDYLTDVVKSPSFGPLSGDDKGKLLDLFGQTSAVSQDRLKALLESGRLTERMTTPDGDQKSALDHLHVMATGPLADGLNRSELLRATIKDLEQGPGAVDQGARGACTVTSISNALVAHQPAEYARLIAGLASPDGRVKLANGDQIARAAGTARDDGSGRTVTGRLLQPALIEFGNGILSYDNDKDRSSFLGIPVPFGVSADTAKDVAEAVFNRSYSRGGFLRQGDLVFPAGTLAMLEDFGATRSGEITGHAIMPLRVDGGRVYFREPNGELGLQEGQEGTIAYGAPLYRAERDPNMQSGEGGGNLYSMSIRDFNVHGPLVLIPDSPLR